MPIKYQKFGLRRDKNLSDLENPNAALGNLLDNLGNEPFATDDLLQAITGLRNTTLTVDDIQKTKGTVRKYTDGNNEVSFKPLQTIEDNIRNFKVYVGDPPFAGGGDGIEALFVPWDAMDTIWNAANEATKKAWTGDQLFDSNYIAPNKSEPGLEGPFDFWDNGIFIFGSKLYSEFTDTFGLVQWEGYVIGGQRFDMELTGLLKIEVDPLDDGNWVFLKNVYDETRTNITLASGTYDSGNDITTITFNDPDDAKIVCIEDSVDLGANTYTVSSMDETTFSIIGDATANGSVSFPLTTDFSFVMGDQTILRTGTHIRVPNTSTGGLVKIRISLYYPNKGDGRNFPIKRFVDFNEDATDRIPYSNFYTEVPTGDPGIYTYEYFEANRLSKRNKFISPRNSSATTTALQTSKLVYANYTPPETHGNRYRNGGEFVYLGGGKFEAVGSMSASAGDWIAVEFKIDSPTSRNVGVFAIQDVSTNPDTGNLEIYIDVDEFLAYDSGITGSPTSVCYVHIWRVEGLIGFVNLTSNGVANQFTMSNISGQRLSYDPMTTDIRSDYMISAIGAGMDSSGNIITPASTFTHFKKVLKNSTSSINVSSIYGGDSYTPTSTNGTVWIAGVYAHTGLQDLSTLSQCAGTYGVEVTATANAGQAIITLTDTSQITNGNYVQFGNSGGGTNYVSDYIPSGVTVTVLNSTQIQLSQNLNAAIPKNATLVFITSDPTDPNTGITAPKEFCVLPLNTAPPFTGTDAGLRTTSTASPYNDATNFPNLIAEKLIFAEAQFPDVNSLTNLNLSANPTYGRTLPITYGGTTYKFLIA